MKTTTIIIDDEQRARILLKEMLTAFLPEVEVLAECSDLPEAIKAIKRFSPKLIFLDIEMPGHSGLEILNYFNEDEINFDILFITAYNQYAIKAFKLSAIDYLLKPVDPDELKEAIDRHLKRQINPKNHWEILKSNLDKNNHDKIAVPSGNSIKFISPDEIVFVKADSSYAEIHFENKHFLVVSRTLKNFEEALNESTGFMRIHKSFLVNINFIREYLKSDGGSVILSNGVQLPISSERTSELLEKMKLIKR